MDSVDNEGKKIKLAGGIQSVQVWLSLRTERLYTAFLSKYISLTSETLGRFFT